MTLSDRILSNRNRVSRSTMEVSNLDERTTCFQLIAIRQAHLNILEFIGRFHLEKAREQRNAAEIISGLLQHVRGIFFLHN